MLTKKKILLALIMAGTALQTLAVSISGAGSSAAQPLYSNWAQEYQQTAKTTVKYDAVGSAAGLKRVKERMVDFGATDVALSKEESAVNQLLCFPTSVSGVIPFINLPGYKAGQLNLNGDVLAKIYEGQITNWNDRAIAAINGGRTLPDLAIHPIARKDGSGSTYIFSDYLSKVSTSWNDHFGTKLLIQWNAVVTQTDGSEGVVSAVAKSSGAIGYVDYGYVVEHHLDYVKLQNHDGQFVAPTFNTFSSALTNSSWKSQALFNEMLTDKPGAESWPITTGTFVLIPSTTNDPEKTVETLKFFTWSFLHGDEIAKKAGYVRLNDSLQAKIFALFTTITDKNGNKLNWSPF